MAKIKKVIENGGIQYPATITDAVKNPNNGKTVTEELSELGSKVVKSTLSNEYKVGNNHKLYASFSNDDFSVIKQSTDSAVILPVLTGNGIIKMELDGVPFRFVAKVRKNGEVTLLTDLEYLDLSEYDEVGLLVWIVDKGSDFVEPSRVADVIVRNNLKEVINGLSEVINGLSEDINNILQTAISNEYRVGSNHKLYASFSNEDFTISTTSSDSAAIYPILKCSGIISMMLDGEQLDFAAKVRKNGAVTLLSSLKSLDLSEYDEVALLVWIKDKGGDLAFVSPERVGDIIVSIDSSISSAFMYAVVDKENKVVAYIDKSGEFHYKNERKDLDKLNSIRIDNGAWSNADEKLNTIVGYNSAQNSRLNKGSKNNIFGIENLWQAENASHNCAFGYHSLWRAVNASQNCAFGNETLDNIQEGKNNCAFGPWTMKSELNNDWSIPVSFDENSAFGAYSQYKIRNGGKNTSVGAFSMYLSMSAEKNTAIGMGSGYNTDGSSNVFIGAYSGYYSNSDNELYIDNQKRGSNDGEKNKSLVYGKFAENISDQMFKINGMFSCNGSEPQPSKECSANATDLNSCITLLNEIRSALIDCGILKE